MSPGHPPAVAAAGFVVDASVAIKLFVPEEFSDKVRLLFGHETTSPPVRLSVPDLFYVECANVLWKYVRRQSHDIQKALQHVVDLTNIELERFPTVGLAEEALRIAVSNDITAYDACYVALSQRVNVPLVTADKRLVRKSAGTRHDIRWLGDVPVGPAVEG